MLYISVAFPFFWLLSVIDPSSIHFCDTWSVYPLHRRFLYIHFLCSPCNFLVLTYWFISVTIYTYMSWEIIWTACPCIYFEAEPCSKIFFQFINRPIRETVHIWLFWLFMKTVRPIWKIMVSLEIYHKIPQIEKIKLN